MANLDLKKFLVTSAPSSCNEVVLVKNIFVESMIRSCNHAELATIMSQEREQLFPLHAIYVQLLEGSGPLLCEDTDVVDLRVAFFFYNVNSYCIFPIAKQCWRTLISSSLITFNRAVQMSRKLFAKNHTVW